MQQKFLQILIFLFLAGSSIHAASQQIAITAADYCEFLNATAATDPQNLFDEKMESDLAGACITRAGEPGNFSYQVIANQAVGSAAVPQEIEDGRWKIGKQNANRELEAIGPETAIVTFISAQDAAHYCTWKGNLIFNFNHVVDRELRSNQITFNVINPTVASNLVQKASKPEDSSWEELAGITIGIGSIILGGGDEDAAEVKERTDEHVVEAPSENATIVPIDAEAKKRESKSLDKVILISRSAEEQRSRAIKAAADGKSDVARKLHEIADQNERSINPFSQAAKAYAAGKKEEGMGWYYAGAGLSRAAEQRSKAIEAEAGGKFELAGVWCKAAEQNEHSFDPFIQAARTYTAKKTEEGNSLFHFADCFYHAAEQLQVAIESEESGDIETATAQRAVAEQYLRPVDLYAQAAKDYAAGKKREGMNWNNAGNGFFYGAAKLRKMIKAKIRRAPALAEKWRDLAGRQQNSVEPFIKAAQAHIKGNTREAISWNNLGLGFYEPAVKLANAIEADANGRPAVARLWREGAECHERSVDFFTRAANAHIEEKLEEAESWFKAGIGFKSAAEQRGKAAEAQFKVKPRMVQHWKDAAEQSERSVVPFTESAEAYAAGNKSEGLRLFAKGLVAKDEADQLAELAKIFGRAPISL